MHAHIPFKQPFPGEPGIANCLLDFPSLLIPRLYTFLGNAQTLHILLGTSPQTLPLMIHVLFHQPPSSYIVWLNQRHPQVHVQTSVISVSFYHASACNDAERYIVMTHPSICTMPVFCLNEVTCRQTSLTLW